ncbi:MAG: endonuclease NucS [Candidatus Diapherotrites archaeon]|nr:endonuclease NucS [Candidatus Diapherotrites archaeon]
MDFISVKQRIDSAVAAKHLTNLVGTCYVEYWGRAASKLPKGKRLLMIKGDGSVALHQNRLLRPTNYMMGSGINCEIVDNTLIITASKNKPKETLKVIFYDIDDLQSYEMNETNDLRLFGSERELSDQLMQDLSFLEPGLKPLNQEEVLRKGLVDILAQDAQGKLVVIELKRRTADFNAVQQLKRYMDQVQNLKGIKTRGLLVAPDIRKNARELLEKYGLEFFTLDFEISNPLAKIKGIQNKQQTINRFFG